jgi:hypothetical protein
MRASATIPAFFLLLGLAPADAKPLITLRAKLSRKGPISWIRRAPPTQKATPTKVHLSPARSVGWGVGEKMTYAVQLAGVEGGRAAISVGRPRIRMGRRTLKLRGLGETVPFISTFSKMSEELRTQIDLEGMVPIRSVASRKASGKDRRIEYLFGKKVLRQTVRRGDRTHRRTRRIIRPVHDPLGALFALRSVTWRGGSKLTLYVLSGVRTLYRVDLRYTGKERIYGRMGPRQTIRISGTGRKILDNGRVIPGRTPRKVTIWLTADRARVPVKLQGDTKLGQITAQITSYHPPSRSLRVRVATTSPPRDPALAGRAPERRKRPAAFGARR